MEEINKNSEIAENFEEFSKQLDMDKTEIDVNPFDINNYVDSQQEEEGVGLKCAFCEWTTHKNAKNKKRGLKGHMKKCRHNPDKIPEQLIEKKGDSRVKVNIKKNEVEDFKEEEEQEEIYDIDNDREKLVGDLDILRVKFASVPFNWNYTTTSSLKHLRRQKSLFLRVLNDEAGTAAMFKLLVIGSKAIEKVADVSQVVNLEGYAQDVDGAHEEIYPILKNLVDTGVLSVGHLTPELRLGMIMASLAINRVEKNKIQKNSFLDDTSEKDQEYL